MTVSLAIAGLAAAPPATAAQSGGGLPGLVLMMMNDTAGSMDPLINDVMTDPTTGATSQVTQILTGYAVLTDSNQVFLTHQAVGEIFQPFGATTYARITAVTTDAVSGLVDTITYEEWDIVNGVAINPGTTATVNVVTDVTAELAVAFAAATGAAGDPGGAIATTIPTGNVNPYRWVYKGASGGDGRDGYGIKICIPLIGCATIAYAPKPGGNGSTGPAYAGGLDYTNWTDITTVSDYLSGATVISIGGNGGQGGDSYGNINAERGGNAGAGGNITFYSSVNIATSGYKANGIYVQSQAGYAGSGGDTYLFGNAGSGGTAGQGGNVHVTNNGIINTLGAGSHGILAQSMGGAAGSGGDFWGIVGSGGSSVLGGNGGWTQVFNNGQIQTEGIGSHGILAQSIGGSGGDGGSGGALVYFGGSGSPGGNGGNVRVTNNGQIATYGRASHGILAQSIGGGGGSGGDGGGPIAFGGNGGTGGHGATVWVVNNATGTIYTQGALSVGVIAQSIGGGGGNGGTTGGVVAFGGSGAGGGNANWVRVDNAAGSFITTLGDGAHAVFAQSIGGGGGYGASAGGVVALGGSSSGGGNSNNVAINSDATITTYGVDARGIFAQSIGGGGGSAQGSGGLVSLGGKGGSGGHSHSVTLVNGGTIVTFGNGSDGILVQGIGGGGGSGAASGGVVSLGGEGAGGGNGGWIDLSNSGTISTDGHKARGIFAQSIGGGGGSGGDSGGLISLGGKAGLASDGHWVTINNSGEILTGGDASSAIQAQSIGGGGGDGGTSGGVFLTMGGSGGGGGKSGAVTVNNSANLTTFGHDSYGIFAQSIGGGGGNGGNAASGSAFAGVSIGGAGGNGGNGGIVVVTTSEYEVLVNGAPTLLMPTIDTTGDRASGIFAQSIGGGGGNGGWAVQGTAGVFVSASVAVGGSGGLGGAGNAVTVNSIASILTRGDNSSGLMAQSVGGGGGNGGLAISGSLQAGPAGLGVAVGIGGSGGGGGAAGNVSADFSGSIATLGDNSHGMVAQSIGGGGGNGGMSVAGTLSLAAAGSGAVGVGVGGAGGGGGLAGTVNASANGTITTSGDDAHGVLFQSVGGGGGSGGFNISAAVAGSGVGSGAVGVGVGGSGGDGGAGNTVTGSVTGAVTTSGDRSQGIIIQSIGGGGGNGGFNISATGSGAGAGAGAVSVGVGGSGGLGGAGGAVNATVDARIATAGSKSGGILVQSIGGGGGKGGFDITNAISGAGSGSGAVAVSVGGSGGGGGSGGIVNATLAGQIDTSGFRSGGVVAQSIGGGGGDGGFSISGVISGAGAGSGGVTVGVGGSGGGGGNALSVAAGYDGDITTRGDNSLGLLFQSVGGGGGNGSFSIAGSISGAGTGSGAVAVGIGGSGGGGGSGDIVDGTVTGSVTTFGNESDGIIIQSVGGGGGNGGLSIAGTITGAGTGSGAVSVGIGGSGGDGGAGGNVAASITADVTTTGDESNGVIVQSVGRGGGNGGISVTGSISGAGTGSGAVSVGIGGSGGGGGNAGTVTSNMTGNIWTEGSRAGGVIIQSIGGGGGNGGLAVAGSISAAGTGSGAVSVGVGGSGGLGGNGSAVDSAVTGDITTLGSESDALLVQSIGGGGGNGGISVSGAISGSGAGSGAVAVGIGGTGGGGGSAGEVTSVLTGNVWAGANDSGGVVVQSVGGGGGNGGLNVSSTISGGISGSGAAGVGVGGFGGGGGNAGSASSTVTGDVTTVGNDAEAVLVQSLGGGGGNGGLNISGSVSLSATGGGAVAVGVGGFGGGGGDAGIARSSVTGNITTWGDDSAGFIAQSLGGGGGNGGLNVSGTINLTQATGAAVGIGLGGFGGSGGNGGMVTPQLASVYPVASLGPSVRGNVDTRGANSVGVMAQSVGGGGGNGGLNVSSAVNISMTGTGVGAGIGVGGFGGGGGSSGSVYLWQEGDVSTSGANSSGVIGQSIGGGGGNGGINVSGAISYSSTTSGALALGLGGFGGGGGNASSVDVRVAGNVIATGLESDRIETTEAVTLTDPLTGNTIVVQPAYDTHIREGGSHGIIAQSLGGGGGNGGINVSGAIAVGTPGSGNSYGLTLGVGGFGGGGGDAGAVILTVTGGGLVSAVGDNRYGILAQSIGGGGGNGALNVSGGIAMDGVIALGLGGFGGDGGLAGDVTVISATDITSAGTNGIGLLAQSVGGGGGNGGINVSGGIAAQTTGKSASIVFGMGGFGGSADKAGNVSVTYTGNISSEGSLAHGLVAQSIGGGGGNGALNVSGNLASGEGVAFVGGLGGHGGAGADAGNVTVISSGNIMANGATAIGKMSNSAIGILAQSIGGGGGNGGMNVSGAFIKDGNPIAFGVGGFGSGAGDAGAVSVTHDSSGAAPVIIGYTSAPLPGGDPVPVYFTGIYTTGDDSKGILAQSLGGGGGNAGMNFVGAASWGSSGGGSGDANRCAGWDPRLAASTCANWSKVVAELQGRNPSSGSGSPNAALVFGLGGFGGAAGNAGSTTVNHIGNIVTEGARSEGILAQSIGGGGGNAALNIALSGVKSGNALGANVGIGGATGDGGNAGAVTVNHSGDITTLGVDSAGIHAQSVGGGGGNAALNIATGYTKKGKVNIGIGRKGGTGGTGGAVSLTSDGTIITMGDGSIGLLAQSIGGGGGKSGSHSGGLGGGVGSEDVSLNLSLGLEGGLGATSSTVDVTASGIIQTHGKDSHGIYAQSTGGGGGVGGMATTPVVFSSTVGLALGGAGGVGAESGAVTVTSDAQILTLGDKSHAIYAQSIGGGGGSGGMAVSAGLQTGKGSAVVSVGGKGGTGAKSELVTVSNAGDIRTEGEESYGIYAQSLGGGGGNGGMTVNGVISKGNDPSLNVSVAVGGEGGTGAMAGSVDVTNTGTIHTVGTLSEGIRAQSIGGGGGNGGLSINAGIALVEGSAQFGISVGGTGGTGGTGGGVTVTNGSANDSNIGLILTEGDQAHGIFAQSLGSGGGNGGSNISLIGGRGTKNVQLGVSIGGKGGSGGAGGAVTVTNYGMVETLGDGAHGIFAESVGGGGGNGGMVVAANVVLSPNQSASSTPLFAMGGSGGDGNDGGSVEVNNHGTIVTHGDKSHGIFAQSVGGGGGNGSLAIGVNSSADPADQLLAMSGNLISLMGDSGGSGGLGGNVTVNHSGDITVYGAGSEAIVAQSVNGGGGNLAMDFSGITGGKNNPLFEVEVGSTGTNDAAAGTVTVNVTGTFGAFGDNSIGHSIQAIGGGGGVVAFSLDLTGVANPAELPALDLTLGGSQGFNNRGGDIATSHTGDIVALGQNSYAVGLQSIGGGGGRAVVDLKLANGEALDVALALGGTGLTGGAGTSLGEDGGIVDLQRSGAIVTTGDRSHGLFIQSIGGGGGVAQISGAGAAPTIRLGGLNELVGHGGVVSVVNDGDIWTEGQLAHGVFLQSIGGGGGAVFTDMTLQNLDVALGGRFGGHGDGGAIAFTQTGNIQTTGNYAYGIFAQSLAGGGGVVDLAFAGTAGGSGVAGAIDLSVNGDVLTFGEGSTAIFAQSEGLDGAGNITLSIGDGFTILGGTNGYGVQFQGGALNTIHNMGTVMTLDGIFGTAIRSAERATLPGGPSAPTADDTIENYGTVTGSVVLGGGLNFFLNEAGGVFNSGILVELDIERAPGSEIGALINHGLVSPGGIGLIMDTTLSGSFRQSGSGTMATDLDLSRTTAGLQADRLSVSGSAELAGTVALSHYNVGYVKSGTYDDVIISAGGGVSPYQPGGIQAMAHGGDHPDLILSGAPQSAVASFRLVYPNAYDVVLHSVVDFSPQGLNGNQTALGDHINDIQLAGGSEGFAPVVEALFYIPDVGALGAAYNSLSPEVYADAINWSVMSNLDFREQMLSCRRANGIGPSIREGQCRWVRFATKNLDRDASAQYLGYEQSAVEVSGGSQWRIGENAFLGFGLSIRSGSFETVGLAEGTADVLQTGVALKKGLDEHSKLSLSLSGGYANYNTTRLIDLVSLQGTAQSDPKLSFVSSQARYTRLWTMEGWYIKSDSDLGLSYAHMGGFAESGAGGAGLTVEAENTTLFTFQQSIEAGAEFRTGGGGALRPYARLGILHIENDGSPGVSASFIGAPDGVGSMRITGGMDKSYLQGAMGLDVVDAAGVSFRLEGTGQASDRTTIVGINAKLGFAF